MRTGRPSAHRAFSVAAAAVMLVATLPLLAPPAEAGSIDNRIVYVEPLFPAVGHDDLMTVRPVTGADGEDYFAFILRVRTANQDGTWTYQTVEKAGTYVRFREIPSNAKLPGRWGGQHDAFALAGDPTRMLITVPASAAPSGQVGLEAVGMVENVGFYNRLKATSTAAAADALDVVPTPLAFNTTSAGVLAYSAELEVRSAPGGYDVHVRALSPYVEETTVTTPHGAATVTLDKTAPALASFAGDPTGAVASTAATRFTLPTSATFGDPVARFLLCRTANPCTASVPKLVTFENATGDGNPSFSPPGEPLTYTWEWGDGVFSHGAIAAHEWEKGGVYAVKLVVQDASGRTGSAIHPIVVLNQVPTGSLTVTPNPANRADTTSVIATASDPDGVVVSYLWFLDDVSIGGTGSLLLLQPGVLTLGTHTVRTLIKDDSGAYGVTATTFTVVNLPPKAAASAEAYYVQPGIPVTFSDASTDRDGVVIQHNWAFGDGGAGGGPSPGYAFASEGDYVPTLVVTDNDGATDATTLPTIIVDGTDPLLSVSHPAPAASGWYRSPVTFTANAVDDRDPTPSRRATANGGQLVFTNGGFTITTNGEWQVVVSASDWAKNQAFYETFVRVDQTPPGVHFTPPGPYATGVERLVVTGSDATSGVAKLEIAVNGRTVASSTGPDALVFDWDTTSMLVGRPSLTVRATDEAGHVTSASSIVTVLNGPLGTALPKLP